MPLNTTRAGVYPVQAHASPTSISCALDPAPRQNRRKKVADTSATAWEHISAHLRSCSWRMRAVALPRPSQRARLQTNATKEVCQPSTRRAAGIPIEA